MRSGARSSHVARRRVIIPDIDLTASALSIDGPDFHHLVHVLRMLPGDELVVLDNRGAGVCTRIDEVRKREMVCVNLYPEPLLPEPPVHVTIAQAIGKGDKFEQVIQHGTEVGASAFLPLITERTVVRLDAKEAAGKLSRWQAVAKGAAEQCGRSRIPSTEPPASLTEVCSQLRDGIAAWLLDRSGQAPTDTQLQRALILVGPEGGFSEDEIEQSQRAGCRIVSLGPYTLRTETAALVALSRLLG